MIEQYRREVEAHKDRLHKLEKIEIERMAKEAAYKEELFNNHGKPASYFKVPNLVTRVRSNSRRFRRIQNDVKDVQEELDRQAKLKSKARSVSRNGRFVLDSDHDKLVAFIQQREAQLKNLISMQANNQDYLYP